MAYTYRIIFKKQYNDPLNWVGLTLTLVGLVPLVGDIAKFLGKTGGAGISQYLDDIVKLIRSVNPDFVDITKLRNAFTANWDSGVKAGKEKWQTALNQLSGWLDNIPDILFAKEQQELAKVIAEVRSQSEGMLSEAFAGIKSKIDEALDEIGRLLNSQGEFVTPEGVKVPSNGVDKGRQGPMRIEGNQPDASEPGGRQAPDLENNVSSSFGRSKFATAAKIGEEPSEYTIRVGTVRMKDHPNYQAIIQEFRDAGFQINFSDEARLEILEVVDKATGERRVEKTLYVIENMRYTDLEHELGHLKQFQRFGDNTPPIDRVEELPDGRRREARDQTGIITKNYNSVMEYHNFLAEFLRLHSRGADPELLREHAQYVRYWRGETLKRGVNRPGSSLGKWVSEYFPDLSDLINQYNRAKGFEYE